MTPGWSLSRIVSVAVLREPITGGAPPEGGARETVSMTVRLPSSSLLSMSGTLNVLVVALGENVRCWLTGVKSLPGTAVPAVADTCTVLGEPSPPVRLSVMVAELAFSFPCNDRP